MKGHTQRRGSPGAVALGRLSLRPPLKLLWNFEGVGAEPLVIEDGSACAAWSGPLGALVCLDADGKQQWALPAQHVRAAFLGGKILATVENPSGARLFQIEASTGAVTRNDACEYYVDKLLAERSIFVGSTLLAVGPGQHASVVAAVSFADQLKVLWKRETRYRRGDFPRTSFDWDVACSASLVFVGCGDELVALDLGSGDRMWNAPLADVGGGPTIAGKWVPMVSEGHVVITLPAGTAAFSTETGERRWVFPRGGCRTVYGGRVYIVDGGRYYVLDLRTGECLLEKALAEEVERKWRLQRVTFPTYLAVSETHGFVGDQAGRLYALERDTGEPVWMHQPEGISGFSGNIPVIAGNRLYISSFSMAPAPPPRLYCYEGAG